MNTQPKKSPLTGAATEPLPGSSPATGSKSPAGAAKPGASPSSSEQSGRQQTPLQPSIMEDAADTARSATEDLKETAGGIASDAARASEALSADLKQAAQSAQRAVKEQASEFAADVGEELSHTAEEQKIRGVEAMQGFARAITTAAGELEGESPVVARYVRDVGRQVEVLSRNLRGRSITDLMGAASDLARSQPVVFIAGAVAAGFALSRFLKSSASRSVSEESSAGAVDGRGQRSRTSGGYPQSRPGGVRPGTY
jgi:hypothetical protein